MFEIDDLVYFLNEDNRIQNKPDLKRNYFLVKKV